MHSACFTPVLFLVFNRPDLARRVYERIRQAQPTQLFIAADGPREGCPDDLNACQETRDLVNQVDWPCEVKILFRDRNLGCRAAISEAITWFFEHVECGIILEDDCVPDSSFFQYCSELLERYKDDERVMSISGDCFFPDDVFSQYSYTYSAYLHVWGWATWRRAWKHFNPDFNAYKGQNTMDGLTTWLGTAAAASYWADIMRRYADGRIDTWDYPWLFSCWRNRGISIVPEVNLVSNIGFDSRGTHVGKPSSATGRSIKPMAFPLRHPPGVARNNALELRTETMYSSPRNQPRFPWHRLVRNQLKSTLMKTVARLRCLLKPAVCWILYTFVKS